MDLTIDQRVRAVIGNELALDAFEPIASEATFTELGADSMDSYSLVSALELEFGIEIPDYDLKGLKTVRQMVTYIQEKVGTASV